MKTMKILFLNPCLRKNANYKILPVGLASVMTFVKQRGYDFDLLDVDINEYSDEYVESYIRDNRYDVILYGSIVTHYKWIKWLTHTIKKLHPQTKVVVGNSVAGSCYQVFMENSPADVVVIGEGEYSCAEVLDAFSEGKSLEDVKGVAYRDSYGRIIKTPRRPSCKIDDLPMVEWNLFDDRYIKNSGDTALGLGDAEEKPITMPISTARGCINKCTFCHYVFWNDPYRFRSPENILAEVKRNMTRYGAKYFNFWDDLSFASIPQVEKMLDAISESGLRFNWSASIRTDLLGNSEKPYQKRLDIAKQMKAAGCAGVGFSLESANSGILTMMKKRVKPEYFSEQIQILKEVGIACNVSVVFGYPIETKETIHETFNMCVENDIYPSIGFLLPLPYTGMYAYAKEHGFITDEDAYLTSITERQDICLNMTKMLNEEILVEIESCAKKAKEALGLGLSDDHLIKTGGYKKHTNLKKFLGAKNNGQESRGLRRNENDVSFNYSQATFAK